GVVAVPLGVAVFPVFSEQAAQGKFQEMGETFIKILRRLMFVMMPAAVLFFILRAQIVRLTLGYGRFDWADTVLTIETLGFFLIGLIFQGALAIILRGFFALEDARTPFLVLFFGVLLSLAAALFLAPVMDVSALGLGMAAAAIFNTLVLFFIFKRRVKSVKISGLLKPMSVFALGSVMAGLAAYAALYYLDKFLDTHKVLHLIVQSGSAGVLGVAVYLAVVGLFNMEEVNQILKKIKLGKGVILPSLDEETHQS
ncbi:MAG: oligosaccharide flippase family protein, partial [Candidatus Sungbacteria bacterium]|nr:oligosaccharide flippase family protein [Candidatus Sungbacteria bacterium]